MGIVDRAANAIRQTAEATKENVSRVNGGGGGTYVANDAVREGGASVEGYRPGGGPAAEDEAIPGGVAGAVQAGAAGAAAAARGGVGDAGGTVETGDARPTSTAPAASTASTVQGTTYYDNNETRQQEKANRKAERKAERSSRKDKGSRRRESQSEELLTPSFERSVAKAREAVRSANELQPTIDVELTPVEAPFTYNQAAQALASDLEEKGLWKRPELTAEQVRNLRGEELADYARKSAESVRDRNERVRRAEAEAAERRKRVVMEAGSQLRSDLSARKAEILDAARSRNDGADMLTQRQMRRIGTSPEELHSLRLDNLIPPQLRYDGIDPNRVAVGDEPYLAYRRTEGGKGSAMDRLVDMVNEQVRGQVTVEPVTASGDDLTSLRDYVGEGVAPAEIGSVNERVSRKRQSRVETQMAWLNPLNLFKDVATAETMEDQGFEFVMASFSPEVQNAISSVSAAYHGLSVASCLRLVMERGGIAYDNFGKMKPDLRDSVILELCNDLVESERINGLPNNMVTGRPYSRGARDERGNVVLGGTRCFPFGYTPTSVIRELMELPGSKLEGMTMEQVRKMEWEQFMRHTLPAVYANAERPQLEAYRNGMTALLELDHQNPNHFDIPTDTEMTVLEVLSATKDIDDPDIRRGALANAVEIEEAGRRARARYDHTPQYRTVEDPSDPTRGGHTKSVISQFMDSTDDAFRAGANYMAAMGAMNVFVDLSAIPEGALAAIEGREVAGIEAWITKHRYDGRMDATQYLPSEYLMSQLASDEAKEAFDVLNFLFHLDGMGFDMLAMYQESGRALTRSDLAEFVRELRGMSDRIAHFDAFLSNLEHFWGRFMTGEGLFLTSDVQQWGSLMSSMMAEYADNGMSRGVFTSRQMDEAINQGGVERFIRDMMFNSNAARDAYMFVGLNTFNAKNPFSQAVEQLLNRHGITKFMFGLLVDRYAKYGVNKVLMQFPLSNTLSYITTTGMAAIGDRFGIEALSNVTEYQAGARSATWFDGLRRNLMYDAVHHGNKFVMAAIIYGVISLMGGLGLPDDEDKYGILEEYRIGGADGMPVKYAWWLDDIMGCSAPLAYALYLKENGAVDREGNHHDVDFDTYTDVFWNGCVEQVSGTVILDMVNMVRDTSSGMAEITMMMEDPEGYAQLAEDDATVPPDWASWGTATLEHYLVSNTLRNAVPAFVNQLIPVNKGFIFRDPNGLAHTAWSKWDTEDQGMEEAMGRYDTTGVGYLEGKRRQDSQDNILYALLNDIINVGIANKAGKETGYMYEEQALATKTDAFAMWCLDRYSLDPWTDLVDEDGNALRGEARELALNDRAVQLISDMTGTYDNAYEATAHGFVIPDAARWNAKNYCWMMYEQAKDDYDRALDENPYLTYMERRELYKSVDAAYDYWIDDIYYKWLANDTIPNVAPKYLKQETDYQTYYVDGEGRSASFFDMLAGNATKETYGFGNAPNDFLPFTTPRTEDKGFNYETPAYFDVPGYTDRQALADVMRGNEVPYGMDKGEDLEQLYFGGQPDMSLRIPTDGDQRMTISHREYIRPDKTTLPDILKDPTKEAVEQLLGVKCYIPLGDGDGDDDADGKDNKSGSNGSSGGSGGYRYTYYPSGGYSRSYSGGGGSYSSSSSSSYNPKIYSSPRQVNGDRASGLSTRSPYKATTTYLRPDFYTKGSREAYKRSDI